MMKLIMDITVTTATPWNDWTGCTGWANRDGVIFHPYNDGFCGLHDYDNWTGKIFGMDSSTFAAAQTEIGIKSKVAK